jgi:tripartite ATP-independent transporter DctP family solute receptor
MKLKSLCLVLAASVMGVFLTVPNEALAAKRFRVGHIQNIEHPIHQGLLKFKEVVEKESKGEIQVEIFANSQLGDALTQISSVRMGTLTAFVDGVGWYGQLLGDYYLPATAYAIKNWESYGEVMGGDIGKDMAEKLRSQFGLKVLDQAWGRLPRNVLSVKPIRSIADVSGMKLRIPELKSYIVPWKAMGASPTPIAFAEVYLALQQGVAEGLEAPVDALYTQRLHEVAKYLILTRHQMETASFVMSDAFYNDLSATEKKIVDEGAKAAKAENDRISAASEATIIDKMKKEGVTVIEVDINGFYDKAKSAPAELEASGTWTKGLAEKVATVNAKH